MSDMKPYDGLSLPEVGEVIDIKSTQGDHVYESCEVIGVGASSRGSALWLWVNGAKNGVFGRVHAYIPLSEIEGWQVG